MNFELLKRKYADKTIQEIAKEAIELGYHSKQWTHKTAQATQLRDVISVRIAKENNLCTTKKFDEIMEITNNLLKSAQYEEVTQ